MIELSCKVGNITIKMSQDIKNEEDYQIMSDSFHGILAFEEALLTEDEPNESKQINRMKKI